MSPYRKKEMAKYLALGFSRFIVIDDLTPYRGKGINPSLVPDAERANYTIVCRPATKGHWGKSVVFRAIRNEEIVA